MLPMVDSARVFAYHGVKATIVVPPSAAAFLLKTIQTDQESGLHIAVHVLHLPPDQATSIDASDMSAPPSTDTTPLIEPFRLLLSHHRPDCVVVDSFHRWSPDLIDGLGIPRIIFNGGGCFARCAEDSVRRHEPYRKVASGSEPFALPDLPHRIEMTASQIPAFVRSSPDGNKTFGDRMARDKQNCFGALVNSFVGLEPAYAQYFRARIMDRVWLVGPVSLRNTNVKEKAGRGGEDHSTEAKNCLQWLDSKSPNSVLYVSFGSLARLPPKQLLEIAYALEASDRPFIWVVRNNNSGDGDDDGDWLPEGFAEGVVETGKGLIIRGWAPQLLILGHAATGGYVTHCGWNSTLEAVSAGVPVVTWPVSAEQFYNEKLLTDVLRIGVRVGCTEWGHWNDQKEVVGRERVAEAVGKVMGDGEEAAAMRRRAAELAEKAKEAVEEGGSSYAEAEALINELKSRQAGEGGKHA